LGGTNYGRYRVLREIGRGAMAVVYLCEDTSLYREVALKSLSPQYASDVNFRERFQREGRILARVRHESIVPIYDFGEQDQVPYIIMEHMPGGTLADRITSGSLTVDETLEVLTRVATALDAAHAAGVVHRDLKPANILFDNRGRAFVGDFGVGRMDGLSTGVTMPGTVIGTAQYMSPEQVNGAPPTSAADIYSFGALAYEALVGRAPFRGDNVWDIMRQHLEDQPKPPGIINPALAFSDDPILTALSKDPAKRPPSATTIAEQLTAGYRGRGLPVAGSIELTPTVVPGMAAISRPPTLAPTPAPGSQVSPPSMAGQSYQAPPLARPKQQSRMKTIIIAAVGAALAAGGIAVAAGFLLDSEDDGTTPAGNTSTPTSEAETTTPATSTATPTATTAPTEERTRQPEGEIVLIEAFEDPNASQVPQPSGASGRTFMQDGRLYAEDFSASDNLYAPVEMKAGAVNHSIAVDAFSPNGIIILTCRGDERFEFRFQVKQKTAEFRTQVFDKSANIISTIQDWKASGSIHKDASNRYELFCTGDTFDATVNAFVVATHTIPGVQGDGVSFGVDGGVQATFDNVEIRKQ
jgi:serine/threonine protein kinase